MNSSSHDLQSTSSLTHMSELVTESPSSQPLITTNDIDITSEGKLFSSDSNDQIPFEPSPSNLSKKQKSLLSVYDNSTDGEQQRLARSSLPTVGIVGRNRRSRAFTKRLLLSGFSPPILCDFDSSSRDANHLSSYASSETFYQHGPSIVLITDNVSHDCEHLFNPTKRQLIVDAREVVRYYSASKSARPPLAIPEAYRAFGNLSNVEIENGTERVAVAVETSSPADLIEFIHRLKCFSRGIAIVDGYSYSHEQTKPFQNCLFPLVTTIIAFTLSFLFAMVEYNHQTNYSQEQFVYRHASSIAASTSLALLSVLFVLRPLLDCVEMIQSLLSRKEQVNRLETVAPRWMFLHRWLHARRYLAWYSLGFGLLHVFFLLIIRTDFKTRIFFFFPVLFGLFTLVLLCILSFVYFPWISERLLWREYHLLTSYLGPCCLVIALIHVFIHWKYEYQYLHHGRFFHLTFLSMVLPSLVVLLQFALYGLVRPTMTWIDKRRSKNSTATSLTA